jgi:asparagine N-glycosylation enzyme membrane subunit Stt3
MNRSVLLTIDGIINMTLGVLLILLPAPLVEFLGIPVVPRFFPNILGGVLIGIGIALFLERGIKGRSGSGLGLDGAIAINLCAGLVLAGWLILGDLSLPMPGQLFLWILVILLLGISIAELIARIRTGDKMSGADH